jgi:hypothetical protein
MKTKLKLLSLASMLAVSNMSAIEIGPTGSGIEMSGFIDLFYQDTGTGSQTGDVGQVEFMFDYAAGPVSASVDFDFYANTDGKGKDSALEEAIITYDLGNGMSVTGGKMLSYMGFEAYDPTNMYQFSYAYDAGGSAVQNIYDAYDYGISFDYGTDAYSIGLWTSLENSAGYEVALAYTGIENFTAKAIWSDFTDADVAYDKSTFWVSYQLGKLLLAAEVAQADFHTAVDADGKVLTDKDGFLIMGNYAITDKIGLTLRYSEEEISTAYNSATLANEFSKITISPSYVFTDNLSGLIEYSIYEDDVTGNKDPNDLFAVEFIYTF